jgi:hypothetical protein
MDRLRSLGVDAVQMRRIDRRQNCPAFCTRFVFVACLIFNCHYRHATPIQLQLPTRMFNDVGG